MIQPLTISLQGIDDYELALGAQIRRLRIRAGLDQVQLAAQAGVSRGAVKNLENGRGSALSTLIKVLRTLKQEAWLLTLSPATTISPMQMLRDQRLVAPRQKVYRRRRPVISDTPTPATAKKKD